MVDRRMISEPERHAKRRHTLTLPDGIQDIAYCNPIHYTYRAMIKSFRHKGIERFFLKSDSRGINPKQASRLRRMLDLIDQATSVGQLEIPGMYLHPLKGARKGTWAMTVSGNWRITFRFEGEDAIDLDLEDYH